MRAQLYLDGGRKVEHVREAVAALSIESLIGQQYFIDGVLVFARDPNAPPRTRTMFPQGMAFTGRLGVHYLQDSDAPVDSLTVNFREPLVVDPDVAHCHEFKAQTFQVPVLTIDSHVSLGRAV